MSPQVDHETGPQSVWNTIQQADPQKVPTLVDMILSHLAHSGASDAHFNPSADGLMVSYRLEGVLQPIGVIPQAISAQVIARLKVISGLLTYRTEIPQEGRIPPNPVADLGEIRISTFPTLFGERAALRLVAEQTQRETLEQIGLEHDVRQALERAISATSGMIIITGPAGSGKTTTFYACLREIIRQSGGARAVMTLEDPVESAIQGISQTALDPRAGLDLAALVKAIMRQDPDVIGIGEIRDKATARAAFQATLTGHLVLSTIHAGDCIEVLTRLTDMRIAPYILRSGLRAVLAQRLLRRLCPNCRIPVDSSEAAAQQMLPDQTKWFEANPQGCADCRHSGYSGRVLLSEWLEIGENEMSRALASRRDSRVLRRLMKKSGVRSLLDQARTMADKGLVSPSEIIRVLGLGHS